MNVAPTVHQLTLGQHRQNAGFIFVAGEGIPF